MFDLVIGPNEILPVVLRSQIEVTKHTGNDVHDEENGNSRYQHAARPVNIHVRKCHRFAFSHQLSDYCRIIFLIGTISLFWWCWINFLFQLDVTAFLQAFKSGLCLIFSLIFLLHNQSNFIYIEFTFAIVQI